MQLTAFGDTHFSFVGCLKKKKEKRKTLLMCKIAQCPVISCPCFGFSLWGQRSITEPAKGSWAWKTLPGHLTVVWAFPFSLKSFSCFIFVYYVLLVFIYLDLLFGQFQIVFILLTDMLTEFAKQTKTWCIDLIWKQLGSEFWTEWWVTWCFLTTLDILGSKREVRMSVDFHSVH